MEVFEKNLRYATDKTLCEKEIKHNVAVYIAQLCFGGHGELACAIKFANIYVHFFNSGKTELARVFLSVSVEELAHLSKLLELIDNLGYKRAVKSAVVFPDKKSINIERFSERQILIDALCTKRALIHDYERLVCLLKSKNEHEALIKIIEREKIHVEHFEKVILGFN